MSTPVCQNAFLKYITFIVSWNLVSWLVILKSCLALAERRVTSSSIYTYDCHDSHELGENGC